MSACLHVPGKATLTCLIEQALCFGYVTVGKPGQARKVQCSLLMSCIKQAKPHACPHSCHVTVTAMSVLLHLPWSRLTRLVTYYIEAQAAVVAIERQVIC